AKPMHAGKAAFNGVFAADLAAAGFTSAPDVLEPGKGLSTAILQDSAHALPRFDVSGWEVLRNTFKPHSCCLLAHAAVDAARPPARKVKGQPMEGGTAGVSPRALQTAGKATPATPLEAKFSTACCVALGLLGRDVGQSDFSEELLCSGALQDLMARTKV